jgi:hypothetical protein
MAKATLSDGSIVDVNADNWRSLALHQMAISSDKSNANQLSIMGAFKQLGEGLFSPVDPNARNFNGPSVAKVFTDSFSNAGDNVKTSLEWLKEQGEKIRPALPDWIPNLNHLAIIGIISVVAVGGVIVYLKVK